MFLALWNVFGTGQACVLPEALAQENCLFTDPLYLLHFSIVCSSVSVSPLPFPVLQVNIQILWSKDEVLLSVDS